jgi:hypothetical protein
MSTLTTSVHHYTEFLTCASKPEKEIKDINIRVEEIETILFIDHLICLRAMADGSV